VFYLDGTSRDGIQNTKKTHERMGEKKELISSLAAKENEYLEITEYVGGAGIGGHSYGEASRGVPSVHQVQSRTSGNNETHVGGGCLEGTKKRIGKAV